MKFCIIGLGVFGKNLARNLTALGVEVLAIDRKEENVSAIKDEVGAAAVMDFDDPSPLERFPLDEMDAVIIAIGDDFEASMLMTARAQDLGAKKLVCRVLSPVHERLLRLMKVDRLVVPEEVAARGLAQSLLMRGVVNSFDLGDGHAIIETPVPKDLVGKKPASDVAVFREADIALVAVKRTERRFLGRLVPEQGEEAKRKVVGFPDATFTLATSDVLVLFGPEKKLRAFLEEHAGD
jgi:trk system potassium uptake protein